MDILTLKIISEIHFVHPEFLATLGNLKNIPKHTTKNSGDLKQQQKYLNFMIGFIDKKSPEEKMEKKLVT